MSENCEYVSEHFSQYLAGALDQAGRRRIEEHTGVCPDCARLIDEQRRLNAIFERARAACRTDASISPFGERRLVDQLKKRRPAGDELSLEDLEKAAGGTGLAEGPPCSICGGPHPTSRCPHNGPNVI